MNKIKTAIAVSFIGIAMAIGVGGAVGTNQKGTIPVYATNYSTTFGYSDQGTTWSITNATATDSTYYKAPSGSDPSVATYPGVFTNKTITSAVTITINHATFGQGNNPTESTFQIFNSSDCSSQVTATKSGTLASSSSYTNVIYTVSQANAANFSDDLAIKITKPGRQIRFKSVTIAFSYSLPGTPYSTTISVTGGAKSGINASTAFSSVVTSGDVYLTPSDGYRIPTSGLSTAFTISSGTATINSIVDNSDGDVKISLTGVGSNFTIGGSFELIPTYTVTYTAGSNGSGSYLHTSRPEGTYTLLAFNSLTGVSASSGYRFKNYTVGGQQKNPGDTFTLNSATSVTVNFEVQPLEFIATFGTVDGGDSGSNTALTSNIDTSLKNNYHYSIDSNFTVSAMSYGYPQDNKTMKFGSSNNNGSITVRIPNTVNSKSVHITNVVVVAKRYHATDGTNITISSGDTSENKTLTTSFATYTTNISSEETTTATISTASTTTDKRFYIQAIHLEYTFTDVLDEDLTLDGYTESFYVGDPFEFGGTATATYSVSGDADVTGDVTFELAGSSIEEGDLITSEMVGEGVEVAVWYEDPKGNAAGGSYTINIAYTAVTSVSITTSTSEIAKTGTFPFGATVLPSTANPAVTWSVAKKSGDITTGYSINSSTGLLTLNNADAGGVLTVTATTVGKDSSSNSKTASFDITVTGNPVVITSSSLNGYTGKNASLAYSFSNFTKTLSVVSTDTSKVTVGDPTVTSGTSGSGTVQVNFIAATGESPVSVSFKHGSDVVVTCSVSVTTSAVSSVTWSASNITCYPGSTLTSSMIEDNWEPIYEMNNGDSDYITSDYTIKLGGVAIDLPHTWSVADSGKTLTLTYGGVATSTNNPTITVVQPLNEISARDEYSWEANGTTDDFTSTSTTLNGVAWTNTKPDYTNKASGTVSKRYIQIGKSEAAESFTIRTSAIEGTITRVTVDCASGSAGHTIAISVGGTSYLSATATPTWSSNEGNTKSGTGTSSGEIVITFDKGSNTKAMYIHSIVVERSTNIANQSGHESAQAAVVEFAQYMNVQMNGTNVCSGTKTNRDTAWANVKAKYNTLFGASRTTTFDDDELAYAKDMLANATAAWNEDHDGNEQYCLERAMATYEFCVEHYYSEDAFMSAIRPLAAARSDIISFDSQSDSKTLIIVVISLVSLTAVGGYLFIRKRKEQ